jgi:hypothetical protein
VVGVVVFNGAAGADCSEGFHGGEHGGEGGAGKPLEKVYVKVSFPA